MVNFVLKKGKKIKNGYTTGSFATAATCAALFAIFTKSKVSNVELTLPSGEFVKLPIENIDFSNRKAIATAIKDAGDDPDVTHGASICAEVSLTDDKKIVIDGGIGVGRVTTEGLKQKIGEAAINPVPMKMIESNIMRICDDFEYKGGVKVLISVPRGEEIAKNTFNPRLGIKGGISILGTTGIVEPMSEKAIIDTIKLSIDKISAKQKDNILIVFGNYGEEYAKNELKLHTENTVQISNFVGESLDYIKYKGFKNILLVGHTGKIVKLAGAIMDTHSKCADCRMEIISAHSALHGAKKDTIFEIMSSITTDKAFEIISNKDYFGEVLTSISEKISFSVNYRLKNEVNFAFYAFGTDEKYNFHSQNYHEFKKIYKKDLI